MPQAAAVLGYGYRYRRWVLDSLRFVDARDLATGGDHIPELSDVYVDVALVSQAPEQASGEVSERHSIGELLDRRAPLLLALVGQPGSGKSTLLAHAARRSADIRVFGRRRRMPVLLALRECAALIVTNPGVSLPDVIRAVVGGAAGKVPGGWWERQLGGGRCLVLLDGLDEVARDDDRRAVAGWVEQQVTEFAGNHFVVTSRSYGLPDPLAKRADVLVVRPFTAEQVRVFLEGWYLAAERHATGASGRAARRAARMRADESAARLGALLRAHPALQDLSVNPLLLTMIATAHRYRGALPGSRADLYGEICQVLLSRRAQAKDLPELLPWSAKQSLLAALAYQMMRDHVTEVSVERVLEVLGPQLERFPAGVTGEAFLEDVSRSGLLAEGPGGLHAFTHLTFQEYLAARHVNATPDLVKTLADNVDDPWWHETVLLYATAGDASPVVRACLGSGTIPALTLAFDCDEASAEIDPELRERLDRERRRAYEPGCPPAHRRLIAGVQATRLVRRTLTTGAGTRICAWPVPGDLYWLFLADTHAPPPDGPRVSGAEPPATGVWGAEAEAFVRWLNSVTAPVTGIEVRLPRPAELEEAAVAGVLNADLQASVTGAWTEPGPGLWLREGRVHPHVVSGAMLREAVTADARGTGLLPQVLTAAVLNVALDIARDLDDVRALGSALDSDLAARAVSEGESVGLMHAHAHAIVLTYRHALELTRSAAITGVCGASPELAAALDLAPARALAEAVARDLAAAIDTARLRAIELADAIDLDLGILSAFDFDVTHSVELARVHAAEFDGVYSLARSIPDAPDPDLARVFGLPSIPALDPTLPLPGVLGLPLRWVAESPLASTLLQVVATAPTDPQAAFAQALSSRARVEDGTPLSAALGSPLTGQLRALTTAAPAKNGAVADWNLETGLARLTDVSAPVWAAHQPPAPAEAAALRAVALALADGAVVPGADAPEVLRTAAATVTLVERRGKGESTVGESILLALV